MYKASAGKRRCRLVSAPVTFDEQRGKYSSPKLQKSNPAPMASQAGAILSHEHAGARETVQRRRLNIKML